MTCQIVPFESSNKKPSHLAHRAFSRLKSLRYESRAELQLIICSSAWKYCAFWGTVLLCHAILALLSLLYAVLYGITSDPSTENRFAVSVRHVTSLNPRWQMATAVVMLLFAVWHLYRLLTAFISSVIERRITFSRTRKNQNTVSPHAISSWQRVRIFRSHFGVDGKYFIPCMNLREWIEISFQTYQAYWMSALVPVDWLKNLVVGLIVINAWMTPIIEYKLRKYPTWERLMLLVTDAILDFIMSYCLNIIVFGVGLSELSFDPVTGIADWDILYAPRTRPTIFACADIVFIQHGGEFATICFQGFGLLISLEAVKGMIKRPDWNASSSEDVKTVSVGASSTNRTSKLASVRNVTSTTTSSDMKSRSKGLFSIGALHILFTLHGLTLLIIHGITIRKSSTVDTSSNDPCHLEVYPWFETSRSCSALEINCYRLGIDGSAKEIEAILKPFDPSAVYVLQFTHCPALEVPTSLRYYSGLYNLDIYNSTVVTWSSEAALTETWHPEIKTILIINSKGFHRFPDGMLSDEFPTNLVTVTIVGSDLREIPENMSTKWHKSMLVLQFIHTELTTIPDSLSKMTLISLNLYGNSIRFIPPALLKDKHYDTLNFGHNPGILLPTDIGVFSANHFDLRDTNITIKSAPSWLNDENFFKQNCVLFGGTEFCTNGALDHTRWSTEGSTIMNRGVCGQYKYECGVVSNDGVTTSGFSLDHYIENYKP